VARSCRRDGSLRAPDTKEVFSEDIIDPKHGHRSLEPEETLSHHEEEPPQVVEETSGPDQAPTPDDQWDFSFPVSMPKKKKKVVKKTSRPWYVADYVEGTTLSKRVSC
jgi:hypothetical protein